MNVDWIYVKGAREHNLKDVELTLPKRQLIVFTGPSGSGKSSLAFDTLYAEGQRRYVESLSAYARQFLGQMEKPDYDEMRGLSPTISIEQKSGLTNPRSTVGTITEIYDYLRVLYARIGRQDCHQCGEPVGGMTTERVVTTLSAIEEGTKFVLLAPLVRNRKGEFRDLFADLRQNGFTRAVIDGEMVELHDLEKVTKTKRHTIDVVVDRLIARPDRLGRLADSIETGLRIGEGRLQAQFDSGPKIGTTEHFSLHRYCDPCGIAFPELTQQSFSFNSPLGMCPSCNGLGTSMRMDPRKIAPNDELSLAKGALAPFAKQHTKSLRWHARLVDALFVHYEWDRKAAWRDLPAEAHRMIIEGSGGEAIRLEVKGRKRAVRVVWTGLSALLLDWYRTTESDLQRDLFGSFLMTSECEDCGGSRLRAESRAVHVAGRALPDLTIGSITAAAAHFDAIELHGADAQIGEELIKEIRNRLGFLLNVGLGYLSISRPGPTLSGGEAQRIRLASQLGSQLSGVLYILDEPSIGLHQRDNRRLLQTLQNLRDLGNTVIVVEHDEETMQIADWIVDFGPGAGTEGGEVCFSGPPAELLPCEGSITADYLSGRKCIAIPTERRQGLGKSIVVRGARSNNLQDIDVSIPLGTFTCVTGVSGAGKSTLIGDILFPALANASRRQSDRDVGLHRTMEGTELIDKVIEINQKPIGRTPRSNPATYTGLFDDIRTFFAGLPESRMYGYKPGRFSFNVAGGRCEACKGAGVNKIEMLFLADVYVTCESCRSKRFNDATLRVKYREHSISDVLNLSIRDASELFKAHPRISRILGTLLDVGLGYLTLGQSSTTLSGGEAQRIKLSRELAKIATGDTMYFMDEPSTGLHFEDVRKLLLVIQKLVDAGNTVVMIEHNLDIIKVADHVIDMGPDGGDGGGEIVVAGTPEDVAACKASHTGRYLHDVLTPKIAALSE